MRTRPKSVRWRSLTPPQHVAHSLRRHFVGFDWRRDMTWGVALTLGSLFLQVRKGLSAATDWHRHPVALVLSYLVPLLAILISDALWKVCKSLLVVYREREDRFFREDVQAVCVIVIGLLLFAGFVRYIAYLGEPQFLVDVRLLVIGNIRELPKPNASVDLLVRLENITHIPTITKQWTLTVTTPEGETISGFYKCDCDVIYSADKMHMWNMVRGVAHPYFLPGNKEYVLPAREFIYATTANTPIKDKAAGAAQFRVVGVREELLLAAGTELKLCFVDGREQEHCGTVSVPLKETAY